MQTSGSSRVTRSSKRPGSLPPPTTQSSPPNQKKFKISHRSEDSLAATKAPISPSTAGPLKEATEILLRCYGECDISHMIKKCRGWDGQDKRPKVLKDDYLRAAYWFCQLVQELVERVDDAGHFVYDMSLTDLDILITECDLIRDADKKRHKMK
ncbi:hypothetical protein I316_08045 [Kwoniella heveanensis BCC8398]|uniref:Uncharacterized protein n=1 Tax=Kwoniella heveanensis BCC8398 TaxID=1296120 RepID=A0A1B9GH78_9TREE|nr:hypothetical protein I316_08045 [Kwoniella heveanensis BCC8398]